tara:strand:- start:132 stop:311 length:180 start_codon:yes stop_codon:yes gene_type:complete
MEETYESFDIRNFMDYEEIKKILITKPTELCLFEVTCILINNVMKDYYKDNKKLYITYP